MSKRVIVIALLLAPALAAGAAAVELPRTGQTTCYGENGVVIDCGGTGQDGDRQAGVGWTASRFTDNRDGTVTDTLTGLVWLKDADCRDTVGGIAREGGLLTWSAALTWSNNLASGKCGLSDNSVAGEWRLPNINELRSLVDYSRHDPALSPGHPFVNVRSAWYWSSTSNPVSTSGAFNVGMSRGSVHVSSKFRPVVGGESRVGIKSRDGLGVWPVRDGR